MGGEGGFQLDVTMMLFGKNSLETPPNMLLAVSALERQTANERT